MLFPRHLGQRGTLARDTLHGTLDLLVLKTLARGPEHGYGITCRILNLSNEQLRVEEGSLYPALRRMEADGLIKAEWKVTDNSRRARYYSLTAAGRKRLAAEVETWREHTAAVSEFLDLA